MKAPTAEQLLQQTIESYNSSVNDMSKFRLNKRETELFVGMIESHTQAHTKALREENATLEKYNSLLIEENRILGGRLKELEEGLKPIANTHDAAIEIDPIGIAYKMRNAAEKALKKDKKS